MRLAVPFTRGSQHRRTDRSRAATIDINHGKMNGFIAAARQSDVMGYHDAQEIPNYWAYAKNFVLQDRMFEPVTASSLSSHLSLVSGWSAECS